MTIQPDPGFFTGCLWPTDPTCVTEEWEALDEPVKIRALALASSSLERLVARRVTNCPITIRPCADLCGCARPSCGACRAGCELTLDYVGEIVEVAVDGETLPLADFRIDDRQTIVYTGSAPCPFNAPQNLSLNHGEVGTWSVTYLPAAPVDTLGAQAVTLLALEFAKACIGSNRCALPKGVRTIARFGMTYEVEAGLFPDGFTNIRTVDAYIESWNPKGRREPLGIYSPDNPTFRVVT